MNLDYQSFNKGECVKFEIGTARDQDFISAEGRIRKIDLFFSMGIALMTVHVTKVSFGNVEIGEVIEIANSNVTEKTVRVDECECCNKSVPDDMSHNIIKRGVVTGVMCDMCFHSITSEEDEVKEWLSSLG